MSSRLRQRLGWGARDDALLVAMTDRSVMARALMYLLAAVGTAVVASVAIPDAPLADEGRVVVLAGIAYVSAIAVLFGFERLPEWGIHALLLGVTGMIVWAIYETGDAGSPYKIFFVWVALYGAFFFSPWGAAFHVAAMLALYGTALIELGGATTTPGLHWVLTASALILIAVAVQALTIRLARLVDRLTQLGRVDSVTGLYNAAAFSEMLENEVERARRSGNRLGVVIAELDDFAAVTDGPATKDHQALLAHMSAAFRATPRKIDLAARLGAGRFALVLPYTDEHGAYLLAERMRERTTPAGLRASYGISGFPRSGASAQQVFQAAELALSEAREAGGDRVMMLMRAASSARVEIDVSELSERG